MFKELHKFIVHCIGGRTDAEYADLKKACEHWANKNLKQRDGVVGIGSISRLSDKYISGDIVIYGSDSAIYSSTIVDGVVDVAPWVENCSICGCIFKSTENGD